MLRFVIGLGLMLPVMLAAARIARAKPDFEPLVRAHAEGTIQARRWLHQHAELSLREHETQAWLTERLREIPGVELVDGAWGTGLVALLRGGEPGPVVAYRADMDALPIREETGLPYACARTDSLHGREVGVMHACGHDIHMAVLLGTARVLSDARASMPGAVLLVLQPGEEVGAGARALVDAGLFEDGRRPVAIFGIHDHPTIDTGKIGYCPGQSTANVDEVRIRIRGEGGHGAYPHRSIDPVVTSAQTILALQSIVSREVDPLKSAVITVGSIQGGSSSNVIPDFVDLRVTVRTLEPDVRQLVRESIIRTTKGIAEAAGCPEPEITYIFGTPAMYNEPTLVEETIETIEDVIGKESIVRYPPALGGEDFSVYQTVVPGFMFRLGVGRPEREMSLHNPAFDPDERAIPLGMRIMSEVIWDRLSRPPR